MAHAALTTIFTPPASCFNNQYTFGVGLGYVKDPSFKSAECYPHGYRKLFSAAKPFSPGVCPSGYVVANSVKSEDVTSAMCCPPSWTPYSVGVGCSTRLKQPTTLQLPTATAFAPIGATLAMHAILVAWASSDLKSFTPASAPLLAMANTAPPTSKKSSPSATMSGRPTSLPPVDNAGGTASPSPTSKGRLPNSSSTAAPAKHKKSSNGGLSAGAAAGVGVVIILVALSGGLLAFVYYRRRRRRRPQQQPYVAFDEKNDGQPTGEEGQQQSKGLPDHDVPPREDIPPPAVRDVPIPAATATKKTDRNSKIPSERKSQVFELSATRFSSRFSKGFARSANQGTELYELSGDAVKADHAHARKEYVELEGSSPRAQPWVTHFELSDKQ